MDDNNTKKLFKQYKFLNKKTLPDGFECGDGWYKLVYDMCKEIKAINPPAEFVVTRVINKYEGLEIHTKNGTMRTRVVLDQYNTLSMDICDACGNERDLEKCDKCTVPVIEYPDPEDEDEDDSSNASAGSCGASCAPSSGGT